MLKSGFETDVGLQHCLGRWGGERDSYKTCKRLLITVEVTISYFSLKCYQVSQGLMATIVVLFHGRPLTTPVNLEPIGMPPIGWDF